jgi:hypothetical protein
MTAKTQADALAIEPARGAEHIASIRAEAYRAGAEAMRRRAADALTKMQRLPIPEIDR